MISALPDPVLWTLVGIFGLLTTASVSIYVYGLAGIGQVSTEIRLRTRSWWIMAALFAGAIMAGGTGILFLVGIVCFLALREYLSLIPTRSADRRVLLWAYLTVPLQFIWVATESYAAFSTYIPICVFTFLPVYMLRSGETSGFTRTVGMLYWGIVATVYNLSHIAYLLVLPGGVTEQASGIGLVVFLVLLAQLNDVAQYCAGKIFGGPKIAQRISPNKTWAGLLGGVAFTTALALGLAPWLTPFGIVGSAAAGLLIAGAGFAGDLILSAIKRDIGVKDTSSLLPGHGGILDRVDSLILSAPLFFHFTRYLYFS